MNNVKEMQQELAQLVADQRVVLDKTRNEKRAMNTEEQAEYDKREARVDVLDDMIAKERRLAEREKTLPELPSDDAKKEDRGGAPAKPKSPYATEEYRKLFDKFLRGDIAASYTELRSMQADSDVGGGFITTPQRLVEDLIKNVDDQVIIRQRATKIQVGKADSLGVPTLETDLADAEWVSELSTGTDDEMTFGKRELHPHALAKRVRVSNKLLRVAVLDVEALIRERLAYKLAITEEKAFLTGSGFQQPLGLFTPSADGIPTSRDVSTDNTATAITGDGLISALSFLKPQYQQRATWIFHRDAIRNIRKLKTGDGQYIWVPGLSGGAPSTIFDRPYMLSENAPNTFTTGQYVGLVGDLSFYWIADSLSMQIQRLTELYAETNQVGFILRAELDAAPVLPEGFVRMKLA